jgi:hypothetical protein
VFLAISLDAARAECVLSENNMALARVVTEEAKLYFVSGPVNLRRNARPLRPLAG